MLPFRHRAKVLHNGEELGEIALTAWPLGEPRESPGGEVWDYEGHAEIEGAELLVRKGNRRLEMIDPAPGDPPTYTVRAATRHDFLPHLELRLLAVTG